MVAGRGMIESAFCLDENDACYERLGLCRTLRYLLLSDVHPSRRLREFYFGWRGHRSLRVGLCFSFLGGIRRICTPANFGERPLERPILPDWSANELSRRMGLRRAPLGCAPRVALGKR